MGRVAAVTFLTEPKRRPESPAAASPPRPGQRHQRGAPVRAAPARPLQPGLPLAASRRRLSQRRAAAAAAPRIRPRRRGSGPASRRGRCESGQALGAAGDAAPEPLCLQLRPPTPRLFLALLLRGKELPLHPVAAREEAPFPAPPGTAQASRTRRAGAICLQPSDSVPSLDLSLDSRW